MFVCEHTHTKRVRQTNIQMWKRDDPYNAKFSGEWRRRCSQAIRTRRNLKMTQNPSTRTVVRWSIKKSFVQIKRASKYQSPLEYQLLHIFTTLHFAWRILSECDIQIHRVFIRKTRFYRVWLVCSSNLWRGWKKRICSIDQSANMNIHSKPKVLVSSTAVSIFSYSIENEGYGGRSRRLKHVWALQEE